MAETIRNFYYDHPEGFELLKEIGDGGGYDWSIAILFKWNDKYFVASDSGCSCYGPWEDTYTESDFEQVRSFNDVARFVSGLSDYTASPNEKLDMLKVARDIQW